MSWYTVNLNIPHLNSICFLRFLVTSILASTGLVHQNCHHRCLDHPSWLHDHQPKLQQRQTASRESAEHSWLQKMIKSWDRSSTIRRFTWCIPSWERSHILFTWHVWENNFPDIPRWEMLISSMVYICNNNSWLLRNFQSERFCIMKGGSNLKVHGIYWKIPSSCCKSAKFKGVSSMTDFRFLVNHFELSVPYNYYPCFCSITTAIFPPKLN